MSNKALNGDTSRKKMIDDASLPSLEDAIKNVPGPLLNPTLVPVMMKICKIGWICKLRQHHYVSGGQPSCSQLESF